MVCIGGGVGIAPVYPIVCAMKAAGNRVTSIISARSKDLLILEDDMRSHSDELKVATDDGSYGFKGFPTQILQAMMDAKEKIDLVVAVGPVPMMRAICQVTKPAGLKTMVSLNPIMVDGTGMCGGCRVSVGRQDPVRLRGRAGVRRPRGGFRPARQAPAHLCGHGERVAAGACLQGDGERMICDF